MILQQKSDNSMAKQLMVALEDKNFARFSELLPRAQKGDGILAMEEAIDQNSLKYVKILIPLCYEGSLGGNCIVDASMYGHTDLVREFIPYADTDSLHVALNAAITSRHENTVVLLLEHVDATYGNSYPLQLATSKMRGSTYCAIFEAVFAVSNPQDALNALQSRVGRNAAVEMLEQRISLETKRNIQKNISAPTAVHTRKL